MAGHLPRSGLVLEDCDTHLQALEATSFDTAAIEAYLARHAVLVLCAEIESQVTALIYERVDRSGCDPVVIQLVKAREKGAIRNAKQSEIAGVPGQLSDEIKSRYVDEVTASIGDARFARLASTVEARNALSHSDTDPAVTLNDVRDAHRVGEVSPRGGGNRTTDITHLIGSS